MFHSILKIYVHYSYFMLKYLKILFKRQVILFKCMNILCYYLIKDYEYLLLLTKLILLCLIIVGFLVLLTSKIFWYYLDNLVFWKLIY